MRIKARGGLISDGKKINYLPWENDLETQKPNYEKCKKLLDQGCAPVIMGLSTVSYFFGVTNQKLVFMGIDKDSERIALYTLNNENIFSKISSIGGDIKYISIDNLTSENPSVTVEGITDTISECYDRGVLPCVVANYGQLFYPHRWRGDIPPISTRGAHIDSFYSVNDYGIDRIDIQNDKCTLTQIKFQTIENQ
jgi:hypothetical protein